MRKQLIRYIPRLSITVFLAGLALTTGLVQAGPSLQVSIYGHPYELTLERNDRLPVRATSSQAAVSAEHYRGQIVGEEGSWVRMSRIAGQWRGVVSLAGEMYLVGAANTGESSLVLTTDSPQAAQATTLSQVDAEPVTGFQAGRCGMGSGELTQQLSASRQVMAQTAMAQVTPEAQPVIFSSLCANTVNGICLLAELEVAVDRQFQQDLTAAGLDPESEVTAMINVVEGYYRNDFNIAFDTLTLELLNGTVFDTTDDANDLLDDIGIKRRDNQVSFQQNNRSIFHFLTGREFAGGTAGIAYVGTLCNNAFAAGTTQLIDGFSGPNLPLTALVMAHEIGHNFGASHDGEGNSCGTGFIMEASLNGTATEFSSCSVTSIQNLIGTINTPAQCVNFPIDLAIVANAGNPTEVEEEAAFSLSYNLQTQVGFQSVNQLVVSGSVPSAEGQYSAVRLNGNGCSLSNDNLSYQCTQNNPPTESTLDMDVLATTLVDGAESRFTHQVSFANTSDVVDVNGGNEQLVTSIIVRDGSPDPTPPSNMDASDSGGSGGGGGALGWAWLLPLAGLAYVRRQRWL